MLTILWIAGRITGGWCDSRLSTILYEVVIICGWNIQISKGTSVTCMKVND